MAVAITNVRVSNGTYKYRQYNNEYEYFPSSRVIYRFTLIEGKTFTTFERKVVSDVEHRQLLDQLNSSSSNPVLPQVTNQPAYKGGLDPLPQMSSPKYVPDPEGMILGRVPQTIQYRVSGIGVVPSINPVIMDKSYRPKKFSFKDMPSSPEELQEYVRQVISSGLHAGTSIKTSGPVGRMRR